MDKYHGWAYGDFLAKKAELLAEIRKLQTQMSPLYQQYNEIEHQLLLFRCEGRELTIDDYCENPELFTWLDGEGD